MYRIFIALLLCGVLCTASSAQYNYPATRTVDSSDTYFNVTVKDPYRWLENVKSNEVQDWFQAQSAYTNAQLAQIPGQEAIAAELKALDKIVTAKYNPQGLAGGKYFYNKRFPGEPVYKLYYRQGEQGKEVLLFDPQQYIPGKTMNYNISVNDDGSRVLFNLSEAGAELGDIRVMDVASGKMLPDRIPHSSGNFVEGSKDLIMYGRAKSYDTHDPEVWQNAPCMLHTLGTDLSKDKVIASAQKYPELRILPSQFPGVYLFKNSPYMILGKFTVENYKELYVAPVTALNDEHIAWTPLCTKEDQVWNIFVKGSDIYLLTSKGNPMFRIIKTSLKKPDLANAPEIASGDADWKLSDVSQSRDYLIINKSKNELIKKPYAYHLSTGKTIALNTPLNGNIIASPQGNHTNELILTNLGWNLPLNFYKYDLDTKKFSNSPFTMKISYPGQEHLQYEEVEVPSHDGTLVPLSIVYDKTKFKKDGSNISFMEGYGSYGMSQEPYFSSSYLPLLSRGVVMAIAHVRGGGEKGQEWWLAGKKNTKPNTWKDFNACAEYLIRNGYTTSQKLAITGASAGGILIGRAITERPDLYKVAIPKVGCLNTLRMERSPNGPANIPEFGTVNDETEFKALLEMDAYQHIKKGIAYPAQLITTGFNDPRVESYIPAKFAARMQTEGASTNPVFLYVDYKAGHFGGSTVEEQFAQRAKEYAFILWHCGYR